MKLQTANCVVRSHGQASDGEVNANEEKLNCKSGAISEKTQTGSKKVESQITVSNLHFYLK